MKTILTIIVAILIVVFSLAGCSKSPLHEQNWHRLKVGMSKEQVTSIVGKPTIKSGPSTTDIKYEGDSEPSIAAAATTAGIAFALLGTHDEYWEYFIEKQRQTEQEKIQSLIQDLFGPRDESYVIFFDKAGRVKNTRLPVKEHRSDP